MDINSAKLLADFAYDDDLNIIEEYRGRGRNYHTVAISGKLEIIFQAIGELIPNILAANVVDDSVEQLATDLRNITVDDLGKNTIIY